MPWIMAWEAHSLSVLTDGRFEMGIGTGRPGIEDELRELGLPVVTPGERLSQVRDSDPAAATEEILRRREDSGFSYFVVGANAADALAPVVAELTGH
jgi:hypothetical protein